jgi:hypothetical protein
MWGELLHFNVLTKAATATNQEVPGRIAQFTNGSIARYVQAASTLDNDTLAAGEPCLLLPPGAAWDDPVKLYMVSNVSNATGGSTGLTVGAFLLGGFAAVDIPETYWGWAVIEGYMSYARCYDTGVAAYEYLVLDNNTSTVYGMSLKNADADGQTAYGFSWEADDGTAHTVAAYVNARGIGCMFDIAG